MGGVLSSLRARLLLLVFLSLLPALGLILYTADEQRRHAVREAHEEGLRVAHLAALQQTQLIEGARELLLGLASIPAVRRLEDPGCSALLAEVRRQFPAHVNIGAARPDGLLVCSAVPFAGPITVADRAYFRHALETRDFAVGEFIVDRATGRPSLPVAYPLLEPGGAVGGVLIILVDVAWLNNLAAAADLPPGSTLTVVDGRGTVLARHPDAGGWLGKQVGDVPIFQAILAHRAEGTADGPGLDGRRRLAAFTRLPLPPGAGEIYIVVSTPRAVAMAAADRGLARNLAGLGITLVVVLAVAWVAGGRLVARRAEALAAAARRLAGGDLAARTGLAHDRSELGRLAGAFDEMAGSIERLTGQNRLILDSTVEGIVGLDPDGRVTFANPAAARLCGYTVPGLVGQPLHPLVHHSRPDGTPYPPEECRIHEALREGRLRYVSDEVFWRKEGTCFPVEYSTTPILEDGARRGGVVVFRDITERRRAEEHLRRANRALRVLSASNQALIRAADEPDLLRRACEAAVGASGYPFAWIGLAEADPARSIRPVAHAGHEDGYLQHVRASWADDALNQGPMGHAIRTGRPQVVQDVRSNPAAPPWRDEALRRGYASIIALPLPVAGRVAGALAIYATEPDAFDEEEVTLLTELADDLAFGLATFRARAERARAEAALERQRETAYQAEKLAAMGELLAGVAHELNNPLSVILGRARLLRLQAGEGPLARQAEQVTGAADRCARIVRNFLALARERPPERKAVRLGQILQEAVELLAYQLRVHEVEVDLALAADLPAIWADPHQLHQVAVNLVSNAQQAMRGSPPPRRLSLATRPDAAGTRVVLEVADTGPGIPPDIQGRIFEPFFTTKPVGEGTGLGLSLCRGIVEAHGGLIRVESEPGRGARFVVELPVQAPDVGAPDNEPAGAAAPVPGKSILVVDDEADVAGMMADILAADGYEVEVCASGAAALRRLGEREYDLILTDVRMPDMDGRALHAALGRARPELARRVVFMTGDTYTRELSDFLEASEAPSIRKPFDFEEVRRTVARALRSRPGRGPA